MRDRAISSVVVDQQPWGLVTDRDLRDVVAGGRPPDTPLGEVARPAACAPASADGVEVLDVLLAHAVHHVVLTGDGTGTSRLVGVVTTGDLLRHEGDSPVHVVRAVRRSRTVEELAATRDRAAALAASLVDDGVDVLVVLRALTAVWDAATDAALRLAGRDGEPPTIAWAWLATGSQGRREQGLLTDQDHALVHAPAGSADRARLAALAERTVALLEAAGLPRCPGGAMASRWTGDVTTWVDRVHRWRALADPQGLLDASLVLDRRAIAGTLDLRPVRDAFAATAQDAVFVARLAAAAAASGPSPGRWHRAARMDVKAEGVQPVVDLARVLGLRAGCDAPGTLDRLAAARAAGLVSEDAHATLATAFRFLQRLRLEVHLAAVRAGRALDNQLDPAGLLLLDRRQLREVRAEVRRLHRQLLDESGAHDVAG